MNSSFPSVNDTSFPSVINETIIQNDVQVYVLYSILLASILPGLLTNLYVLWLIVKGARESVASDFFALNLSVAEIILYFFSALGYFSSFVLHQYVGVIMAVCDAIITIGRPLFQCLMCVERYLAVIHPMIFLKYKPLRYKLLCSAMGWLNIFASFLVYLFIDNAPKGINLYVTIYLLFWLFVMLFCCLAVLNALKRPGPGEGDRGREGANNIKMRAFRIIVVILSTAIICYIPLIVTTQLMHHLISVHFGRFIGVYIVVLTGFAQPILYLVKSGKLKCFAGFWQYKWTLPIRGEVVYHSWTASW